MAAPASAAPVFSAALFDERGTYDAWVGPPGVRYGIDGNRQTVTVYVLEPSRGFHSFKFAAPPRQRLRPGVYDRAARAGSSALARAVSVW